MPNAERRPRKSRRTTQRRPTSQHKRPRRRTTRRRTLRAERSLHAGMRVERAVRTLRVPPIGAPQVVSLGIIFAVVVLFVFVAVNSRFYVYREQVTIEGARYTPAEMVYERAGLDGYHVLFIDPERVARRLEELPYVREARVTVGVPATVQIHIEERVPVLVWERADGVFWVDEEGVALPALEERPGLPRLYDPEGVAAKSSEEGSSPTFDKGVLDTLLRVRTQFPHVRVIYYDATWGLRIVVPTRRDSVEVVLGTLTGLDERLARLPRILQYIESQNRRVKRIDLTRPEPVVWEE